MQGSLYLLHCPQSGEPDPTLKEAIAVFLVEIADASPTHAWAVVNFIQEWSSRYPQAIADSPLRGALEHVQSWLQEGGQVK